MTKEIVMVPCAYCTAVHVTVEQMVCEPCSEKLSADLCIAQLDKAITGLETTAVNLLKARANLINPLLQRLKKVHDVATHPDGSKPGT